MRREVSLFRVNALQRKCTTDSSDQRGRRKLSWEVRGLAWLEEAGRSRKWLHGSIESLALISTWRGYRETSLRMGFLIKIFLGQGCPAIPPLPIQLTLRLSKKSDRLGLVLGPPRRLQGRQDFQRHRTQRQRIQFFAQEAFYPPYPAKPWHLDDDVHPAYRNSPGNDKSIHRCTAEERTKHSDLRRPPPRH